jgi:hypothetical protein
VSNVIKNKIVNATLGINFYNINMSQVTSRGCSRSFALCVLWRALEFVRYSHSIHKKIAFPFSVNDVSNWIDRAQSDCSDLEFQRILGGVDFFPDDIRSYWNVPNHFFTW